MHRISRFHLLAWEVTWVLGHTWMLPEPATGFVKVWLGDGMQAVHEMAAAARHSTLESIGCTACQLRSL
jgi:hypothetical protein